MRLCVLGTGKCGTHSIAELLDLQREVDCKHERNPCLWWEDKNPGIHFVNELSEITADVGFYYLPHVERLQEQFRDIKFICLKRDKELTLRSFARVEKVGAFWFEPATNTESWARCFPNYDLPFIEAASRYWDDYYCEAERLESERFRIFPTEALNTTEGVTEILEFAGVRDPIVKTQIKLNCSEIKDAYLSIR